MTRFTGTRILIPDIFDLGNVYVCLGMRIHANEAVKGWV
jgi:hypothetical protein